MNKLLLSRRRVELHLLGLKSLLDIAHAHELEASKNYLGEKVIEACRDRINEINEAMQEVKTQIINNGGMKP